MIGNNEHLATVELTPDTKLAKEQLDAEADVLAKAKQGMSDEQIERFTGELGRAAVAKRCAGAAARGYAPGMALLA